MNRKHCLDAVHVHKCLLLCIFLFISEERQNIVNFFVNNTEPRQMVAEDHLRGIPDFQRLSRKFQQRKASLQVNNIYTLKQS